MNRNIFLFYLMVPLIMGLLSASSQSGGEPLDGISGYLAYWIFSTFVCWQLMSLGSAGFAYLVRPFNVPLIVVLIAGFIIGIALWMPISVARDALLSGFAEEGQSLQGYSRFSDLSVTLANWINAISVWISVNYFFLYFLGMPRFGYQPDSKKANKLRNWLLANASGKQPSLVDTALGSTNRQKVKEMDEFPRLQRRLRAKNANAILALVAEDHYTRVVMPDEEELVYIRFGDAMSEMDGQAGFQVHRSYWINLEAADRYWEKGHQAFIKLSNGDTVPVSRSFRQTVKQHLDTSVLN